MKHRAPSNKKLLQNYLLFRVLNERQWALTCDRLVQHKFQNILQSLLAIVEGTNMSNQVEISSKHIGSTMKWVPPLASPHNPTDCHHPATWHPLPHHIWWQRLRTANDSNNDKVSASLTTHPCHVTSSCRRNLEDGNNGWLGWTRMVTGMATAASGTVRCPIPHTVSPIPAVSHSPLTTLHPLQNPFVGLSH